MGISQEYFHEKADGPSLGCVEGNVPDIDPLKERTASAGQCQKTTSPRESWLNWSESRFYRTRPTVQAYSSEAWPSDYGLFQSRGHPPWTPIRDIWSSRKDMAGAFRFEAQGMAASNISKILRIAGRRSWITMALISKKYCCFQSSLDVGIEFPAGVEELIPQPNKMFNHFMNTSPPLTAYIEKATGGLSHVVNETFEAYSLTQRSFMYSLQSTTETVMVELLPSSGCELVQTSNMSRGACTLLEKSSIN
ncbi:hypothetical protein KIN20_024701 [Parelaphostrongylus tenuis]|uniref:Uncharacterized protein n=1 Tax=Parelaphostrongylus tenuis TaxID=148309 RepID=A0AAD5NBC6_PARTN|nr:hypothetical protein KIN20_024701 [Parelaphostrongylus tenuis]